MSLRVAVRLTAVAALAAVTVAGAPTPRGMVRVEAGTFRPLYAQPGETIVRVSGFAIDTVAVSQASFMAFVRAHPRWAPGSVPGLFADRDYLKNAGASPHYPVTSVSWFAASAYCRARGVRLPTTNEWEYVARADETRRNATADAGFKQRTLELATHARQAHFTIGSGFRNVWGVRDMHGAIAEWTRDFHTIFAEADSRGPGDHDRMLTCSAGAAQTGNASDYAAFMRYAFRATAQARTTAANTGFRCAASLS